MAEAEYILLLGDIHANDQALFVTVREFRRRYRREPKIWFLGDLFGRGPEPVAAWQRLMSYRVEAQVAGNHDWGIIGRNTDIVADNLRDGPYNSFDWQVLEKHRADLVRVGLLEVDETGQPDGGEVFATVSTWPVVNHVRAGIYLLHGGQESQLDDDGKAELEHSLDELAWGYVKEPWNARATVATVYWLYEQQSRLSGPSMSGASIKGVPLLPPQVIIVGHVHCRRLAWVRSGQRTVWEKPIILDQAYPLQGRDQGTVVISPGSVGFSREENDHDASYAVLKLDDGVAQSITFHTIGYDRIALARSMIQKGYPEKIVAILDLSAATRSSKQLDCTCSKQAAAGNP